MPHQFIITESCQDSVQFSWTINLNAINNQSTVPNQNWRNDTSQEIKTITSDTFLIKGLREDFKWQLILTVLPIECLPDRYQELKHFNAGFKKRDFKIGLKCLDLNRLNLKVNFFSHFRTYNRICDYRENTNFDYNVTHLFSNSTTTVFSKCLLFPLNNNERINDRIFTFYNDKIIIDGNISIIELIKETFLNKTLKPCLAKNEPLNVSYLQRDLKVALLNKQFADVTFKVKDNTLHAHKIILASRSPVFQKMFAHDMKENSSSTITIVDVEMSVLGTFLLFLYTGILEDTKLNTLLSLYSIADKYEVESLQTTCRELLITHMSVETAPTLLKLAHMHNDSNLKTITVEFISNHFSELETTNTWKIVLDTDPRLASETLRYVSTHMVKK